MNNKKAEILKAYAFLKPIRSSFRASDQIYFKRRDLKRAQSIDTSDSSQNFKSTNELKTQAYRHTNPS